ncbi:DUF3800 domain-containing protein [Brevundimonas sp.]|uniref:DUF3800 domain-containing protein n=1 Tax=Brevundimonas sp. TaxID=1871086 RepID=UPI00391D1847
MLVYIDESGDAGFRLEQGSSPVFVAAMVLFADADDAAFTRRLIEGSAARRQHRGEFKFSKSRDIVRDQFFRAVAAAPFRLRAIVVEKSIIHSAYLRTDKDSFYEFFVKQMLRHDNDRLMNAKIIIDGSGDREFRQKLSTAIRRKVREGAVRDCRFSDSRNDPLIQLADMCAGAIARSFREDRQDRNRWRGMLGPRIDDIWRFQ